MCVYMCVCMCVNVGLDLVWVRTALVHTDDDEMRVRCAALSVCVWYVAYYRVYEEYPSHIRAQCVYYVCTTKKEALWLSPCICVAQSNPE